MPPDVLRDSPPWGRCGVFSAIFCPIVSNVVAEGYIRRFGCKVPARDGQADSEAFEPDEACFLCHLCVWAVPFIDKKR